MHALMVRSTGWWLCAALLLGAGLFTVYANVTTFGLLTGDDVEHIGKNPHLRELTSTNLLWMLTSADVDYWRPLSFLSHALDYQLFGEWMGGHHVTSVLIHWVNAALVVAVVTLCVQLAAGQVSSFAGANGTLKLAALLAGLAFALHPQHVQSTAWLAERKGLLSAMFSLICVYAYLRAHAALTPSRGWSMIAILTMVLALFSKPMAMTLPGVLLALDIYPLRRVSARDHLTRWLRLFFEKLPYLLMSLAVAAYTYAAVRTGGYLNDTEMFPAAERIVNAARSLWLYPLRWLVPVGLAPVYPIAVLDNTITVVNLLPVVGLFVICAVAVSLFRRGRGALLAALVAHCVILLPVLGLISSGPQSSADRYAYLPDVLLSVALGTLLFMLFRAGAPVVTRTAVSVLALSWLGGLALAAHQYVQVYATDRSMHHLVRTYFPQWRPFARYQAGVSAFEQGDMVGAIRHLEQAVAHNEARPRAAAYLAFAFQRVGDHGRGYELLQMARTLAPQDPVIMQMVASGLLQGRRPAEARDILVELVKRFPDSGQTIRDLALAELRLQRPERAATLLDTRLETQPDDVETLVVRAIVAQVSRDTQHAVELYRRVLEIDPEHRDANHNLTRMDASLRREQIIRGEDQ
ncbi:MAG: tetratricopeptide repeat protein [Pseudomonadota bacterium]